MSGKYQKYYSKVKNNQQNLKFIIETIKKTNSLNEQLKLATFALQYATYNNTGYFTCSFLENFFVNYAQKIDIKNYNIDFKKNTFLHVLTTGYNTGGHTRVVERWIKQKKSEETHSVIILSPEIEELTELKNIVLSQNGDFINFDNSLVLSEKALKLREIALNYEYIILHTHMEDPTATIAFGTEKFTRPVLLYNHASHMFWIGKSIADLVLDIQNNDTITTIKRNIKNPIYLGIPFQQKELQTKNKTEVRKKLGLPLDKKIIVSSGNRDKYKPICEDNFGDIINELITTDTLFYLIGPRDKDLKNLNIKKNKNIKCLGNINFDNGYTDYLAAADLYIDSFPLCGATATIDAIQQNTPVLSLKSVYPQLEYLKSTSAFCKTQNELINKAKQILNREDLAQENIEELQNSLLKSLSTQAWQNRINEIFKIIPSKHKVQNLETETDNREICDLSVYNNIVCNKNFTKNKIKLFTKKILKKHISLNQNEQRQGIPFIFEIIATQKNTHITKLIKLFNFKLFSYTK